MYFLNGAEDTYKSTLIMHLMVFAFLKILHLAFYNIKSKTGRFLRIGNSLSIKPNGGQLLFLFFNLNFAILTY